MVPRGGARALCTREWRIPMRLPARLEFMSGVFGCAALLFAAFSALASGSFCIGRVNSGSSPPQLECLTFCDGNPPPQCVAHTGQGTMDTPEGPVSYTYVTCVCPGGSEDVCCHVIMTTHPWWGLPLPAGICDPGQNCWDPGTCVLTTGGPYVYAVCD